MAVSLLATASAWAVCPPGSAGTLPDAIKDNGERLVCIQNEVAAASAQRSFELELKGLERSVQDIQIQRRFDALPTLPVPVYSP